MGNLLSSKPRPGSTKEKKMKRKAAAKAEMKRIDDIVKRQSNLKTWEINQSWRIVFGESVPKSCVDTSDLGYSYVIDNISQRNIWMENNFLFEKIRSLKPDKLFHPISDYTIRYQPPGSRFRLIIPLDDPRIQESALIQIAKLDPISRNRLVFFVSPLNVNQPMFALPVHPASLIKFKNKPQVIKKLSDYFLQGRITIEEMQSIFNANYDTWKPALYNIMPADWKTYHTYLLVRCIESLALF